RVVRDLVVDRRHLHGDNPVVRASRAGADSCRLPALDRGHRRPSQGRRPSQDGSLMRRRVLLTAATAMLTACTASAPALPSFTLTNQSGQVVRSDDLRGMAAVVNFIFTTCGDACPLVTAQLVRVQARVLSEGLGARVRFVSITVDPAVDTPAMLRRYAAAYHADL